MNNDLEQFSEEELTKWAKSPDLFHHPDWYPSPWEVAALARIALAVKQAKPMAYTDNLSLETLQGNGMACMWKEGNGAEWREQIPLYTTPQPAHTEQVPDMLGFDPALAGSEATVITNHFTPDGWKLVPIEPNNYWAEQYCELTNKDPDGEQSTFICDGVVTTTFREKSKREIAAMLAAAPSSAAPKPESE